MHPNAVAALAHLGYIGPQPGEWEVPRRKRKSYPIWAPPPPVRRAPLHAVTSDATSGVFIPQTSAEWTTFNASNGWANPNNLYLFQEASGSILDKIGTSDLAVAGSPTYAQTVTGWTTKCLRWADATNNQRAKSTAIANVGTTSVLALAFLRTPTTPAAIRGFMTLGTGATNQKFTLTTTPRYRFDENGAVQTTDTNTVPSTVQCFVLKHDHTNSVTRGYITAAHVIMSGTFSASVTGNEFCLGSVDNGTIATIAMDALYCAIWTGANAEKTDQDIKSLMMQLGNNFWNPDWTVAHTAGPSETDTLSESVSVAVSDVIGISESEAEAESLAAVLTAAPALAESEAETESLGAVMSAVIAPSETDTLSELIGVGIPYSNALSESEAEAESLAAVLTAAPALAESEAETESLGAIYAAVIAPSETLATTEQLASVYTATAALSEAGATSEVVLAALSAIAGVSESDTLAEVVTGGLIINKAVSESVATSAALAAIYAAAPSLADTPSFTDFVNIAAALLLGLGESATVGEALLALKFRKGDMSSSAAAENQIVSSIAEATATLFCAIVAKAYGGRIDKL